MARFRQALRWIVRLFLVAAAIVFGTRAYEWYQRPPRIEVSVAHKESVARILALTGRIRPRLINEVVPLVPGRLAELRKEDGVLARIDDRAAAASLAQADARHPREARGDHPGTARARARRDPASRFFTRKQRVARIRAPGPKS